MNRREFFKQGAAIAIAIPSLLSNKLKLSGRLFGESIHQYNEEIEIKDMAIGQVGYVVPWSIFYYRQENNYHIRWVMTIGNIPKRGAVAKIKMLPSGRVGVFESTVSEEALRGIKKYPIDDYITHWWRPRLMPVEWLKDG